MAIANRPSKITLPQENKGWKNIAEFLIERFPLIEKSIWLSRLNLGKVHWQNGDRVDLNTAFVANRTLCYYREVEKELEVPFEHNIIHQDQHILVTCKPHFLPVTPGGQAVNECLLERLRQEQDLEDIVAMHRLDRETAGLVIFSINAKTRGTYCQLFADRKITKCYQAVAQLPETINSLALPQKWSITNRLQKSKPAFIMHEVDGDINAHSEISLVDKNNQLGLFDLKPITGKTHQLRLHMSKIGTPILNDKFYPKLLPEKPENFEQPLQLLAKSLSFIDPISGIQHHYNSQRKLSEWIKN